MMMMTEAYYNGDRNIGTGLEKNSQEKETYTTEGGM